MANVQKALDNITQETDNAVGTMASAATLVRGLGNFIAAHKEDPVALQAMADKLHAGANDLAQAVASNPVPDETDTGTDTGAGTGTDTGAGGTGTSDTGTSDTGGAVS